MWISLFCMREKLFNALRKIKDRHPSSWKEEEWLAFQKHVSAGGADNWLHKEGITGPSYKKALAQLAPGIPEAGLFNPSKLREGMVFFY
jgi:hypothetical protein